MVRGSKMWLNQRKLAILAAIYECFSYAEAKYCAFEIHGEPKYYVCPRTEYCCNFGCCVSPGFQIYHLWYYWLLVIIMFLVCSGGGWWYRYWLQGRYRPSASAIPPRTSSTRTQSTLRGPTCRAQQARVTYNPARNTVLLHRMWKGPQRNVTPPAYNGAAASSAQFQDTNVVLNENNCPYYELYGPPPSYETVIAQTRGKIRSPTPVEQSRTNAQVGSLQQQQQQQQPHNIAQHCFTHNYASLPTSERRSSCGSNSEESDNYLMNFGCKNFGQKCNAVQSTLRFGANPASEGSASGTRAQNNVYRKLLPLCLMETETETEQSGERRTLRCSESSPDMFEAVEARGNFNGTPECASSLRSTQNVVVSGSMRNNREPGSSEGAKEARVEMTMTTDSEELVTARENDISVEIKGSRIPKMFTYAKSDVFGDKYRRGESNSLREKRGGEVSAKWKESRDRYCKVHRHKESCEREKRTGEEEEELACGKFEFERAEAEAEAEATGSSSKMMIGLKCEECVNENGERGTSELNPSNIVILSSPNNPNVQINSLTQTINIIENYQHYPPTTTTTTSTTISSPAQLRSNTLSTNIESENKLGRSKSLD